MPTQKSLDLKLTLTCRLVSVNVDNGAAHNDRPPATTCRSPSPAAPSGLGAALVRELLDRGARVAFVARHRADVERTMLDFPAAHGIVGDVSRKEDIHPIAIQILGALGGLDVLVNNASSLGPVPLQPLADTACEDLELALATNLVGPFRLTKALLGSLAGTARDGGRPLVVNISSDAAVTRTRTGAPMAPARRRSMHLSRIWDAELAAEGIRVVAIDPGDMDTPLHALAVPDADRSTLKRPETAAREIADLIAGLRSAQRECSRRSRDEGGDRSRSGARRRDGCSSSTSADACLTTSAARPAVVCCAAAISSWPTTPRRCPPACTGLHVPTGRPIEVRLAGRRSLAPRAVQHFTAVVFGAGDYRTPTEHRPAAAAAARRATTWCWGRCAPRSSRHPRPSASGGAANSRHRGCR